MTGIVFAISFVRISTLFAGDVVIVYSEDMKAYASNYYVKNNEERSPTKVINGAGVNEFGEHSCSTKDMWMSKDAKTNDKLPNWFIVDLGEEKHLSKIHVWNYNQAGYTRRGIRKFSVYSSNSESMPTDSFTASEWTLQKDGVELKKASGTDSESGETVNFDSAVIARWIAFHFTEFYNDVGNEAYCGLAEVRFFEEGSAASITAVAADPLETTLSSAVVRGSLYLPQKIDSVPLGVVWGKNRGGASLESWESTVLFNEQAEAGDFNTTISGLEAETLYYFAFYAKNKDDTLSFSEMGTFTTYLPTTCFWTGGSGNGDWSDAGNWNTAHAPHFVDAVSFPASASGVVVVGADVSARSVDFGESGVSLTGEGSLTTARVTLSDRAADDIVITNMLAVALYPVAEADTTNFVFAIGANRVLKSTADIKPAPSPETVILKTGAGTLLRTVQVSTEEENPPYAGAWLIEEGVLDARGVEGVLRGVFFVGGAGKPVRCFTGDNALSKPSSMHLLSGGLFDVGNMGSGRCNPIHVYSGSEMIIRKDKRFITAAFNLYGATVSGEGAIGSSDTNSKYLEAHASSAMSVLDVPFVGNGYALNIRAARGSVPVDLFINKPLSAGDKSQSVTVSGGGIIKSVASNENLRYKMIIGNSDAKSAVTCYLDGSTGAGGQSCVYVHYDSTLAGIGTFGNCNSTTNLAISLNGDGKTPNRCTLAPGTIDENSGAHVHGTMTVGSPEISRRVLFTSKCRLLCRIGENRQCDKLMVYGPVEVEGADNIVEIAVPDDLRKVRAGRYTILEARDGIVDASGNALDTPFEFVCANSKIAFAEERNERGAVTRIYADVLPHGMVFIVR